MASITSNGTGGGLASVGASWAGGVVPVEGDKVTIASTDTITLDSAFIWGDDTTTAITVNGKLSWSRTVNSSLQVKGSISTAATTAANIDMGTVASPIPSGVSATMILNYSAVMATFKYGLTINDLASFTAVGINRQPNTTLTSSISAGATSATVADCTGWAVGGTVVFAETDGVTTHEDVKTIATLTPGTGTTGTITWVGGLSWAHANACPVGYFSSNVTVKAFNTTNDAWLCFKHTSNTSVNNTRTLKNVAFQYVTGDSSDLANRSFSYSSTTSLSVTPFAALDNMSFITNLNSRPIILFNSGISTPFNNMAIYTNNSGSIAFYIANGSVGTFAQNTTVYRAGYGVISEYSQGGQGCSFDSVNFWASSGGYSLRFVPIIGGTFNNCKFHSAGAYISSYAGGPLIFTNCSIGSSDLPGTPACNYIFNEGGSGGLTNITLSNCKFGTGSSFTNNVFNAANPQLQFTLTDKDSDTTSQEFYTYAGLIARDNSVTYRSKSSVRIDTRGTAQNSRSTQFIAQSGVTYTVIGYLRKNSTYGSSTRPTVTISGLGITPVSFTMTNSVDTWEKFTLNVTQSTGVAGNLTLTFTAQSATSTGQAYMDGVNFAPYVDSSRHYGYLFDSNLYRTTNALIQQSNESTVGAYTGIAINHSTQTITLTSNHTISELYDYCYYSLCQTANLGYAEFFTSTDGINYACTYNLTINNCALTGTANINMSTKTLSLVGTGSSTAVITHNAGTLVSLNLTNIVSGSRVQLYDVAGVAELYNGVPGTSLSVPYTWTTNKTIRYRVMYCSGTTAYKWIEANATATSTGLNLTINQELDTIYNTIAIDGSTVTECSIVGTSIVINVDDPDNKTTAQRLLAFEIYWLSTVGGIRDQNLYIEYQDSTHLIFEGGLKIKNLDLSNPLSITGASIVPITGNPADVIDSSGGSININTDRVVNYADPTKYLTTTKFLALKD